MKSCPRREGRRGGGWSNVDSRSYENILIGDDG